VVRSSGFRLTSPRRTLVPLAVLAGVVTLLVVLVSYGLESGVVGTAAASAPVPTASTGHAPASAASSGSTDRAVPTPGAARSANGTGGNNSTTFNPFCAKINTTVCVSIQDSYEPNIIPSSGYYASVEPGAKTDLPLFIKSRYDITPSNSPKNGPDSPISLNVTGMLWNGDPYAGPDDGTVWHSDNDTWWSGPVLYPQDPSYPFWYTVDIAANGSSGSSTPNVFAGESMSWFIELTSGTGNVFSHNYSATYHYTYGSAWPFSPYPGIPQSDGSNATFSDIQVSAHPLAPNWNDSVTVQLNTTPADGAPTNATIGTAEVRFVETIDTVTLYDTSFEFALNSNATAGAENGSLVIGPSYAQVAGAVVHYQVVVTDVPGDQLTTPYYTYTVGGNGSFLSGTFTDDIGVNSTPAAVADAAGVAVTIGAGQVVNVTIQSLNPGTAIDAAELVEYFSYPAIGERSVAMFPMTRLSSTVFTGGLPGLPVGSFVNFTIEAWDFDQHQLVSPEFSYLTPTFLNAVPFVPGNASFFYVYVYDNGSHVWVSNATVQVTGPSGFFNSVGRTQFGVAYPNASQSADAPLLLAANETYKISVLDSGFSLNPLNASVFATHVLSARQTLVAGTNYYVVQEGSAILFYLNVTPPAPTLSPSVAPSGNEVPLAELIASIAMIGTAVPLFFWWRQIRQRRKEEEKRVTL
jgi:hypothetical protein